MDRYYIWKIISYAWTEIGIDESECKLLVEQGGVRPQNLGEVDRIIFKDVCMSFAFETFLVFPLMLWMIIPDWGYNEAYLKKRVDRWYVRPYWLSLLNPLRLLGYPLAVFMALKYRSMIRRAVRA